jgi:hypothetical protein
MRVVCIVIGVVLLYVGMTSLPRVVGAIGADDGMGGLGRGGLMLFELAFGVGFIGYGIWPCHWLKLLRESKKRNLPPN